MTRADSAVALHDKGCNCCQSVLCAFAPSLGLDQRTAMRLATGFGGGMGRMGLTCGAVTGAFMALGLAYGMKAPEDAEAKEKLYAMVNDFSAAFKKRHSSIECRQILGVDLSTPEGRETAREKGLFSSLCNPAIRDAAEIVEKMLK